MKIINETNTLIDVFTSDGDERKEEQFAIDTVMSCNHPRLGFALNQFGRELLEWAEHIVVLDAAQKLIEKTNK